jgi:hypothetical protein
MKPVLLKYVDVDAIVWNATDSTDNKTVLRDLRIGVRIRLAVNLASVSFVCPNLSSME